MSSNINNVIKIALKAGGERTKVIDEAEAQRIVKRFKSIMQSARQRFPANTVVIDKLDLSCRVWTPAAMQLVLQPFLEQYDVAATVETLKCDDVIASLPKDEGLATLACLSDIFANSSGLQDVNFNDNALGTRGLTILAPVLSLPTVTRVYLHNCGISDDATRETLLPCLQGRALTHVALGQNQMGDDGATCLAILLQVSQLVYFSYSGSRPSPNGTVGLLQGLILADTSGLQHLDLNDAFCSTSSHDSLAQVLEASPQLVSLVLANTALSQAGLRAVIQGLSASAARLGSLDLEGFSLTGNDDDDDDDETQAVAVATELGRYLATQSSTLETLVLSGAAWRNAGILALIAASGPLFGGTVGSTGLRVLKLEECRLSGSDVLDALCHNPIATLRELNLVDNADLTAGPALRMLQNDVYSMDIVKVDGDLEEEDE